MQGKELEIFMRKTARDIRAGQLRVGQRQEIALSMLMTTWMIACLGKKHVTVIELGVANGNGLITMITFAEWAKQELDIQMDIYGFDTGTGMPPPMDYRDHPELWKNGDFACDVNELLEKIDGQAQLIIGDVKDTIPKFCETLAASTTHPIAFISLDLDYYSSTKDAMPLLEMAPEKYLPGVGLHVDDINTQLMYNPWCGESLAIQEFNEKHSMRKIHEKSDLYNLQNYHMLHVFDHPLLQPTAQIKYPINCVPFGR